MNLFIGNIQGTTALLPQEESHHLQRVLRLNVGDEVYVTNGNGQLYKGLIHECSKKQTIINQLVEVANDQKRSYKIHMAVAPTKQIDRTEFFLEKSIEFGLDSYHPLITFHSERRKLNIDRLNRIALSAMKQSLKAELTQVHELTKFDTFLENHSNFEGQKFIAHCSPNFDRVNIKDVIQPKQSYQFLIGPEGDFSDDEIQKAIAVGYTSISLGNQRLRTETAALSCVMLAHWMHM